MCIAYKLFALHKSQSGKIFPLYVNTTEDTPIGEWVEAKCGPMVNGKVKSKLGPLCFRPGWHLSDLPIATHIGVRDESGKIAYMKPDTVWCECEYSDTVSYQEEANGNGMRNGKLVPRFAYLDHIPQNGFYRYKTNPNMMGDWIIAGSIKVNRIMTDNEVNEMLVKAGITPMPRYTGPHKRKE